MQFIAFSLIFVADCNDHLGYRTLHCVQKKTPTHIFFHISMNYVWI